MLESQITGYVPSTLSMASLQSFMNLPNRTGSLPLILGIQNRETIQVMQGMIELNEEMMSKE